MVSPKNNNNNVSNMTQETNKQGQSLESNNTTNRDVSAPKNLNPYKQYLNLGSRNNSNAPKHAPETQTSTPKWKQKQNYIDEPIHGIKNQKL